MGEEGGIGLTCRLITDVMDANLMKVSSQSTRHEEHVFGLYRGIDPGHKK